MKWSSSGTVGLVAALLVGALPGSAEAAACCVGATSALPTRVGECEKAVAAVSMLHERTSGWWDATGQLTEAAGLEVVQRGFCCAAGGSDVDPQVGRCGIGVPCHERRAIGSL